MQRRPLTLWIPALLLGALVVLPSACSEASAATPECCVKAAALIEQMDACCAGNFSKEAAEDRTGCCVEGMKPVAEDRPECCANAMELRAQMSPCCAEGMSSADDICCDG